MSDISTAPTLIPPDSTPHPQNNHHHLSTKELQTLHDLQALHSIQSTHHHDASAEEDPDLIYTATNIDLLLRQAQNMIATLTAEKRGHRRRIHALEEALAMQRSHEKARTQEVEKKNYQELQTLQTRLQGLADIEAQVAAGEERIRVLESEVKGYEQRGKKAEGTIREREESVKVLEGEVKKHLEKVKGLERDLKAKGTLVQELTARLNKRKGEAKEQAGRLAKVMAANEELKKALGTARKRAENATQRVQEVEEQVRSERRRRRKAEKEVKGSGEEDAGQGGYRHGGGQDRGRVYGVQRSKSSVISRMFRGV